MIFYYDCLPLINSLDDAKRLELYDTIFNGGEIGNDPHLKGVFDFLTLRINSNNIKYQEIIEQKRKAGSIGGKHSQAKQARARSAQALSSRNKHSQAKQADTVPVPENKKDDFDIFYSAYPKKKSPANAKKAYQKALEKISHEKIMIGLQNYKTDISKNKTEMQFIKFPATWLNQECWNDEYSTQTQPRRAFL